MDAMWAIRTRRASLDQPADAHLATRRHYQKSEETIGGFNGGGLHLTAADGIEVTLDGVTLDTLTAKAARAGAVENQRNKLGYASLTVGDDATITLDHAQIGTVATEVTEKGQFIVKGTQLTAHGKHH